MSQYVFIHASVMENREYLLHIHPTCQFFLNNTKKDVFVHNGKTLHDLKEAIENQATRKDNGGNS